MTEDSQWMTLKDAIDFGAEQEVLPTHAATKILEALKSEQIRSRASIMTRKIIDTKTEFEDWLLHGFDWDQALSSRGSISLFENEFSYYNDLMDIGPANNREVWLAKGIELLRSHVEILWPSAKISETIEEKSKSRSGRKMKHDWPGAAGVIAAYIVDNDYPSEQKTLVEFTEAWFKKSGDAPDPREIQRFVKAVYDQRPGES